jgi:hypothetical protein
MGERVRGDPAAGQLPGKAAAAPAHPRVEHDAAEQVDVEDTAGPAAGQDEAGRQLMQQSRMLDEGRWAAPMNGVTWSSRAAHGDSQPA